MKINRINYWCIFCVVDIYLDGSIAVAEYNNEICENCRRTRLQPLPIRELL